MSKRNLKQKKSISTLVSYDDWAIDTLKNKKEAEAYLQASIDEFQVDGNSEAFLMALRHVAMAQGGISKLAENTELSRETLYRTLSKKGNPRLLTLGRLLDALGFHLVIQAN